MGSSPIPRTLTWKQDGSWKWTVLFFCILRFHAVCSAAGFQRNHHAPADRAFNETRTGGDRKIWKGIIVMQKLSHAGGQRSGHPAKIWRRIWRDPRFCSLWSVPSLELSSQISYAENCASVKRKHEARRRLLRRNRIYLKICNSSGGFSVWFRFVSIKNAAIRMRTGFFLSDPYNFSVGYGYKTNFPCRNRSFLRAITDPNAIFYRRTVV